MKKTNAIVRIEMMADCPHCEFLNDVKNDIQEFSDPDEKIDNIFVVVQCTYCGKDYIIDKVIY